MVDFQERKAGRSREVREMELCTFVTLTRLGRKVEIRTEFENTAKDHRLRVIIPTGIEKEFHYADSVFEVVKRPNRHRAGWKTPAAVSISSMCRLSVMKKAELPWLIRGCMNMRSFRRRRTPLQ